MTGRMTFLWTSLLAAVLTLGTGPSAMHQTTAAAAEMPSFKLDASWPKPLPNNWILGQIAGIAVDADDNVWLVQRARSLSKLEAFATDALDDAGNPIVNADGKPVNELGHGRPAGAVSRCCAPAPAVMKFDSAGNLLQAWGGAARPRLPRPPETGKAGCGPDPPGGSPRARGEAGILIHHKRLVFI